MRRAALFLHASAVAFMWSGVAHAQAANPAITAQTPSSAPVKVARPAPASEAPSAEIVVTGSRTITNGNNSPTPVTVVSPQQALNVQPGTLADALQILPVFSGSRGAGSNPSSTGSVGAGNGAANQLNLRNLGTQETLVLMDGKRVPPTLISGLVDVDSIPQMMVSRVDIVTGGASAVYGSDAVAGVVNYVLDKKLKGFKFEAENGISQRGDAGHYQGGIAWGTDLFDGRGHFEASYQYLKENGILRRSDRSWMQQAGVTGAGTAATDTKPANPYVNQTGLRQDGYTSGGYIQSGIYKGMVFNPDGSLRPFVHGAATGTSAIEIGGDGAYYDSSLVAPLKFNQFFGRFDYDFSDHVHGYAQVGGNFKTNQNYADYMLLQKVTIGAQNPYLLPEYRAGLAAAGQSSFTMNELAMSGPRLGTLAKTQQINASAGLYGDLGGFKWTVDYVHGSSILKTTETNNLNYQNLAEALDAVTDGSGNIVCRVALTDPGSACSPLDPFGAGAASAQSLGYVMQDTHYRAKTILDDVTASVSGSPFSTWAGPVNFAVSGEWRKLSFSSTSDASPNDYADCTGLTNCTQGTTLLWQNTFPASPTISNTVWEGAIETNVPLIKDVPLIRSFTLNGAVRYTSYKTSGDYWTWKIGADWHVTDNLRFRGTRSRDIRAPTLNDLFAPTYVSIVSPTDLLTNSAPRVPGINSSNPNLKAEIGNTLTVGVVWKPMPKLSLSVDYYHIKITNAITQLQGQTPQIQQLCYDSGGTSPYCALQIRPNGYTDDNPSTNAVTAWLSQSINLSSLETMGVDVEINYNTTILDHPFGARFLGAYQPHIYYRQPGVATIDQAGAAFGQLGAAAAPTVRLTGLLHYEPTESFSIDLMERWRNPMKLSGVPGEVWTNNHLRAFATTSMTLTFKPKTSFDSEFFLNVENLFDATPPTGGYTGNGTRAGYRDGFSIGDDPIGRAFTVGIRAKF